MNTEACLSVAIWHFTLYDVYTLDMTKPDGAYPYRRENYVHAIKIIIRNLVKRMEHLRNTNFFFLLSVFGF